jgi:hypothetical protein
MSPFAQPSFDLLVGSLAAGMRRSVRRLLRRPAAV